MTDYLMSAKLNALSGLGEFDLGALDELDCQTLDIFEELFEDPTTDFCLPTPVPVLLPPAASSRKCAAVAPAQFQTVPTLPLEQPLQQKQMYQPQNDFQKHYFQPIGFADKPDAGIPSSFADLHCFPYDPSKQEHASPISRTTSIEYDPESSENSTYYDGKASPVISDLSSDDMHQPKKRGRKRKEMSEEQRSELTRQRNREHAKSTRLRKKQHIEQLKAEVADLLHRRQELLQKHSGVCKSSDLPEYTHTITQLLSLRFSHVTDQQKWSDLVAPGFQMQLPSAWLPGQQGRLSGGLPGSQLPNGTRVLTTMTQVLQDVACLKAFTAYLEEVVRLPSGFIQLIPRLDSESIIMTGDSLMASWTLHLCMPRYGRDIALFDGMLECGFASLDHKIQKLELVYDAGCISQQIQAIQQMNCCQSHIMQQQQQQQHSINAAVSFGESSANNLVDFSRMSAAMQRNGNGNNNSYHQYSGRMFSAMTGNTFTYPTTPLTV